MSGARATLYVLGAIFELSGIVLIGAPDFVPYGDRASRWVALAYRRAANRFFRLIGRSRRQVVEIGLAGEVDTAGSLSLVKSINPGASVEDKVEALIRRDQEAQRDVNDLRERLAAIERDAPRRLGELKSDMEKHVADSLDFAGRRYRPLRIVGALALATGLACTTTASFI